MGRGGAGLSGGGSKMRRTWASNSWLLATLFWGRYVFANCFLRSRSSLWISSYVTKKVEFFCAIVLLRFFWQVFFWQNGVPPNFS